MSACKNSWLYINIDISYIKIKWETYMCRDNNKLSIRYILVNYKICHALEFLIRVINVEE